MIHCSFDRKKIIYAIFLKRKDKTNFKNESRIFKLPLSFKLIISLNFRLTAFQLTDQKNNFKYSITIQTEKSHSVELPVDAEITN